MEKYNPQAIEAKWQGYWEQEQTFRTVDTEDERERFYLLVMFPYPSGRIHMGHVRNYAIGDVMARYQRMLGKNLLHPMGWDAFGMPAENAAIQKGVHPKGWTYQNIATMRRELKSMGLSYDWSREFATCDPDYACWEQHLFLKLYEKGLLYRKKALVNWDPVDHTVLANEQVIDGRGWRSGALVERRELSQWFLRITAYAKELLEDLDKLTGWPDTVRSMQANWIGKSVGVSFEFALKGRADTLAVYTTRPDTVMGVTFCSVAAEHPLAVECAASNPAMAEFIRVCQTSGTSEEAIERMEKRGLDTGFRAIHPFTGEEVPIYAANFVLMNYGTGAVMAVPAHDQRDFEFARKYDIPVKPVIQPANTPPLVGEAMREAYVGPGTLFNSGQFDGLDNVEAKEQIAQAFAAAGIGDRTVTYRLRDWGLSRQRYWGNPIPMIHCPTCGVVPVPVAQLPVALPEDVDFTGSGNPLDRHPTWKHLLCPNCQTQAVRETDTMDTFVESSWYFLRYCCPDQRDAPLDRSRVDRWMPVNHYVGGIEHAVLHLLYARFFHKALRDVGEVGCDEPFTRLLTQGMVRKDTHRCPTHGWRFPNEVQQQGEALLCAECQAPIEVGRNEKMSKSKHNVVDPNEIIAGYGADTARLFMLFAAPPEQDLEWNDSGVNGAWRFINRVWRLVNEVVERSSPGVSVQSMPEAEGLRPLYRKIHTTIAKVSEDLERLQFNTGIAAVMELANDGATFLSERAGPLTGEEALVARGFAETMVRLLGPYTPHVTEELWRILGHDDDLCHTLWPKADPAALTLEELTIVVQVNGKLRGRVTVAANSSATEIEAAAVAEPGVQAHLTGKVIRKVITVPGRLINIVAG